MRGQRPSETETVIKKILPYLARRGYDAVKDLAFETPVANSDRYARGYVDILVTCGKPKPLFLIEAKRSSKTLTAKDRDQALAYGAAMAVPFVVVTNGAAMQSFNVATRAPIQGALVDRIPAKAQVPAVMVHLEAGGLPLDGDTSLPFRPGLALKQLNALFARCHNTIRKIEKNEDEAFADFAKLLFLKLLEEKADTSDFTLPYSYRFHELASRPVSDSDQVKDAVLAMIAGIRQHATFGDVLGDDIHLNKPRTFRYIIEQLAAVSFQDSGLDTKGAAFEYFVRATLKGKKLGQYFTPRPLVELMACLIGRQQIVNSLLAGSSVKVLDPACGTGGFLVLMMKDAQRVLQDRYDSRQITRQAFDDISAKIGRYTFFGADANEGVAAAAKMNMIIAGDGHTNIRAEDTLAASARIWETKNPDVDIVLTNPPFGTSEADSLPSGDLSEYPIRSTKGQHLFLQKMVRCTKHGGQICTVIDEGVLNTEGAAGLRRWLLTKCRVVAVVRLPDETFKPNKINVKASVLYLQRRETDDVDGDDDAPVTFADVQSLGYAGSGDALRNFDFERLLREASDSIVGKAGCGERSGYMWSAYDVSTKEIVASADARLDYKYWDPEIRQQIAAVRAAGGKSIAELNTIATGRGKSPPADLYVDEDDGYALVVKAGSNISRFGELVTDGDYIEKNVFEEQSPAHIVRRGDVLIASTGDGTLGKSCVYDSDRPAIADGHVTVVRVRADEVLPEYLSDYLRCGFGAAQIERQFTGSTGLIELTPEHVKSIVVDLAGGVDQQRAISAALRTAEAEYRTAVDRAEESLRCARNAYRITGVNT